MNVDNEISINKSLEEYLKEYQIFIFNGNCYVNPHRSGVNNEMIFAFKPISDNSRWRLATFRVYDNIFIELIESNKIRKPNKVEKIIFNV